MLVPTEPHQAEQFAAREVRVGLGALATRHSFPARNTLFLADGSASRSRTALAIRPGVANSDSSVLL